jgi:hypothetical protein
LKYSLPVELWKIHLGVCVTPFFHALVPALTASFQQVQLNGSIPVQYWVQMQLQAEVCDVPAVEYFEVQLGSALQTGPQCEEFESAVLSAKLPWIGKVCVVVDHEDDASNTYRYEYSPLFSTSETGVIECLAWKPAGGIVLESALWWVRDYYTTTVMRNKRWWTAEGKPAYEEFWRQVTAARADGRHARVAVPLFVNEEELEETDHKSHDGEDETDEQANDADDEGASSDVEGWKGVASDEETPDLEEGVPRDTGSDLEL